MMKRQATMTLFLIALLFVAAGTEARAQDAPPLNPALVPAEGAREQDFVPRGFKMRGVVKAILKATDGQTALYHFRQKNNILSGLIVVRKLK